MDQLTTEQIVWAFAGLAAALNFAGWASSRPSRKTASGTRV